MAPGGIHNQILLQSRQITHRIADLAAAYTEVVGKTFIALYPKPDQKPFRWSTSVLVAFTWLPNHLNFRKLRKNTVFTNSRNDNCFHSK